MIRTKSIAMRAALLAIGLVLAQLAAASPPHGRMPDDERQRFRQELLEQRRAERARIREQRAAAPAAGETATPGESPRWDGSRPAPVPAAPWRRGDWRDDGDGAQPSPGRAERPARLTPDERRQLRMLLRERHREMRERHPGWRPDDGR